MCIRDSNIGDVGNNDYKVSIDYANGELRPTFHEDAIQLIERDDDGTAIAADDRTAHNYQKTGDLITLPYTEETFTITPLAIENAPVFDISISPEGFTDVATPDPLPTNILPSANVANLL